MNKKTQKVDVKSKKVGTYIIIAVVIAALTIGIASLSITPVTNQGAGIANVKFYTRDGTQINASNLDINIYTCNASGVEEEAVLAFYADFANYELATLDEDNYEGLELVFDIETDFVALLQINLGTYFEDWVILAPEVNEVIVNEVPNALVMTQIPVSRNLTSEVIEGIAFVQCVQVVDDLMVFDHVNMSIQGYWDDFAEGERAFLTMQIVSSEGDYTSAVMNITNSETVLEDGIMYMKLMSDVAQGASFDFIVDGSLMGTPTISLGWVWGDDYTTFVEIGEVLTL